MNIGAHNIDQSVLVIAEIGNNHEGDFGLAKELIGLAAEAGAGAVKFQTIVPDKLVSPAETARIAQLSRYQFSDEQFAELRDEAEGAGVMFLSTPFSVEAVALLNNLAPAFKVASGDNNFLPLIERVCETGKPIIMSTGLASLDEMRQVKEFIDSCWQKNGISSPGLVLLHCVCAYPTEPQFANLQMIRKLAELGCHVGYSDHTLGNEAAVLSVALGARVIEKHFTIDHNHSDFRDHQLSADPSELRELVERVKQAEILLGNGVDGVLECEQGNLTSVRRSIVAKVDLAAGETLSTESLSWVRPGSGIAPGNEERLIGKTLTRNLSAGEMISEQDLNS